MSVKDRLYERKFAKFLDLLPAPDKRRRACRAVGGHLHRFYKSDHRVGIRWRIEKLVIMRHRLRSDF